MFAVTGLTFPKQNLGSLRGSLIIMCELFTTEYRIVYNDIHTLLCILLYYVYI